MKVNRKIDLETNFFMTVILVGLLARTSGQDIVFGDDGCLSQNRGGKYCLPIRDCPPMINAIKAAAPLSHEAIEVFRSYQCGVTYNSVKVCCPDGPIFLEDKGISTGPEDISRHPNFNLLPFECGLQNAVSRIKGGNITALLEFPWMALLSYDTGKGQDFKCAGTVLNDWYILTAAHCLTNLGNLKLLGVRLGEHNIPTMQDCEKEPFGDEYCAPPVQDLTISEVIAHPSYNAVTIENDVGLIRVSSKINSSVDNVKPVCLPITNELRSMKFTGQNLTVTGWGVSDGGQRSPILLKANIPIQKDEDCKEAYKKSSVKVDSKKHVCAGGENGVDSCSGDSGGPLQSYLYHHDDLRTVQFGVVSFGPRYCGQEGYPGVYSSVPYYMNWILDNMKT